MRGNDWRIRFGPEKADFRGPSEPASGDAYQVDVHPLPEPGRGNFTDRLSLAPVVPGCRSCVLSANQNPTLVGNFAYILQNARVWGYHEADLKTSCIIFHIITKSLASSIDAVRFAEYGTPFFIVHTGVYRLDHRVWVTRKRPDDMRTHPEAYPTNKQGKNSPDNFPYYVEFAPPSPRPSSGDSSGKL